MTGNPSQDPGEREPASRPESSATPLPGAPRRPEGPEHPARRGRGRRWRLGLALGGLLLVVLVLAAWIASPALLRRLLERSLRQRTGFATTVGSVSVNWTAAHLILKQLQFDNPADFGGGILLRAPTVDMNVDGSALRQRRLHFQNVALDVAEVHLVRDMDGRLNIERLLRPRPSRSAPASAPRRPPAPARAPRYQFGGVDRLVLSVGQLRYTDLAHPENDGVLHLGLQDEVVRNLRTPEDVSRWLTGLLLRVAVQDFLVDPARSRMRLYDMLARGLRRLQ